MGRQKWRLDFIAELFPAGLLLLKRALVAGRTALPREDAEAYLQWREAYRRLLLRTCDAVRLILSLCVALMLTEAGRTVVVLGTFLLLAAWAAWYMAQVRKFMDLYRRSKPVRMPAALEPETSAAPVVCFRPQIPLSFIRGPRGWAINLANRRSQVGILYMAGLAALAVLAIHPLS